MVQEPESELIRRKPHKRRGRNLDRDVLDEIELLWSRGLTGAAIFRALEGDTRFTGRAPGAERTVQGVIGRLKPKDPSGPWRLPSPPRSAEIDAEPTLRVLGWLVDWTDGFVLTISNRQAQWVTAINRAVPSIPAQWALDMSRRYMLADGDGRRTEELDRVLALRVWEDDQRYLTAVAKGLIPRLPSQHFRMIGDRLAVTDRVTAQVSRSRNSPSGSR